ncbi:hypothetical protein OG746_45355 [Streptomyces sp. NBC_01016]|uniref:hypothetical protein n=1 Tax=Streptomyces sp. NBC_01016 TaxID=2903720 RepID=UPI00225A67AB|nr:hypothetical protein [Streptomyces sp. NBC_01016]MCX4832317.1 hypothetical protein [Streptomyces sp. NBC_01016]MCX4835941.1 hypothetical protein [Streptomyces sp. NBC_01016]
MKWISPSGPPRSRRFHAVQIGLVVGYCLAGGVEVSVWRYSVQAACIGALIASSVWNWWRMRRTWKKGPK